MGNNSDRDSVKKRNRSRSIKANTPSIKGWLDGNSVKGNEDSQEENWSTTTEIQEGEYTHENRSSENKEVNPFGRTMPLQEDWADNETDAEEGKYENYILNKTRTYRNQEEPTESEENEEDIEHNQTRTHTKKHSEATTELRVNEHEGEPDLNLDKLIAEEMKALVKDLCKQVRDLKIKIEDYDKKGVTLERKVRTIESKAVAAIKATIKQDENIQNNKKCILQHEVDMMKPNMIISGIN